MKNRLKNRDYAERVLRAVTGVEDALFLDTILPEGELPKDVIVILKGHGPKEDKDFLLGIFGEFNPVFEPITPFALSVWSMYQSGNVPDLYIAAFMDLNTDEPIVEPVFKGPGVREKASEDQSVPNITIRKINVINTRLDSEVVQMITDNSADNFGGADNAESR
ncbi:MAG: hypothetical protein IJ801_06985 [Lachnospiraceae bacterium]|nr:hypothetical protein [Lachnospiraceae bacterium]